AGLSVRRLRRFRDPLGALPSFGVRSLALLAFAGRLFPLLTWLGIAARCLLLLFLGQVIVHPLKCLTILATIGSNRATLTRARLTLSSARLRLTVGRSFGGSPLAATRFIRALLTLPLGALALLT